MLVRMLACLRACSLRLKISMACAGDADTGNHIKIIEGLVRARRRLITPSRLRVIEYRHIEPIGYETDAFFMPSQSLARFRAQR